MRIVYVLYYCFFFFFKQKTAYEMQRGLVGSEMCIRDRYQRRVHGGDSAITFYDTIQYTIIPDLNYSLNSVILGNKNVTGDVVNLDDYFTYTLDSLSKDDTLSITFKPKTYKITTIVHGLSLIHI
eukprot:TRINITY_DN39076_c0_g1_i1.p3 TRINITY_DN39076_c0_g1~~TRINITY_DN39076_c0_g1_i1.p3  ORF type:complete len:125 (+),score=34.25 TRINITY_DN39076_c0_g1_i1:91-465(+)